MIDSYIIYILTFILSSIQSILGVGILVLGTPILLILGKDFIAILYLLLPISIITSLANYIYFNLTKKINFKIDILSIKIFFLGTVPSIFFGLILLKNFESYLNFNFLVSGVIIFSIIFLSIKNFLSIVTNKFNFIFLILVGVIHGISNSGGSLLSIFYTNLRKKNESRYYITFFYFFLALLQYLLILIIFDFKFEIDNFIYIIIFVIFGFISGNYLINFINQKLFKIFVNFTAILSCLFLIIKN